MSLTRSGLARSALTVLLSLAACTGSGVGGYGGASSGSAGMAGSSCTPGAQAEGCLSLAGKSFAMACGADGKWAVIAECAAGQFCTQQAAAGTLKAICGGTGTGADAIAGTDAGPGADSQVDDSLAGSDSAVADVTNDVSDIQAPDAQQDDTVVADVPPEDTSKPDTTVELCGDGKCENGETDLGCPADCAPKAACGNGECEIGETKSSCPGDCKPDCQIQCEGKQCGANGCGSVCGSCGAGKACTDQGLCVQLGSVCGNGKCEAGENDSSCPTDCPPVGPSCGNGKCEAGETTSSCASDCPPVCGNGKCEPGETTSSCAQDCPPAGPVCGNLKCEAGETTGTCPKDCPPVGPVCGNGTCEAGESSSNCVKDCPAGGASCVGKCDGQATGCYCDDACTQNKDCCADYAAVCGAAAKCGNGKCESGETATNCKADCGGSSSACPNGTCESGETEVNCPQDCKLGCYGDFTLGSTFFKSGDTKQTGLACSPNGAPKNCPDGYWIDFPDTGDCICILSCAGIGVTVGENCTTDGAWKCMDIKATNASGNSGQMCVPTKWELCTK